MAIINGKCNELTKERERLSFWKCLREYVKLSNNKQNILKSENVHVIYFFKFIFFNSETVDTC